MKLILNFFVIVALLFAVHAAHAEKTDEEALNETILLSKKVKEFGKSLGIEPSEALTKSALTEPHRSFFRVYIQGKRKIKSLSAFTINFSVPCGNIPLKGFNNYAEEYSIFVRCIDEYAGNDATITPAFAKGSILRKVEVLLHEDLHANTRQLYPTDYAESIITPIAYLAALKYFESIGDAASQKIAVKYIDYYRTISKELLSLADELRDLYARTTEDDNAVTLNALNLLDDYPTYKKMLVGSLLEFYFDAAFEAKISHDLNYYKDFEKIILLSEKANNLKVLIEDIKQAPNDDDAVQKYLEQLDQKYSNQATIPALK